jgi:tetratricopeptide (TPR) repeat protein
MAARADTRRGKEVDTPARRGCNRPAPCHSARLVRRTIIAIVATVSWAAAAQSAPERHLLSGAAHFRAGRYDEALVEFRVAEKLGAGPIARWYAASALTQAGRSEDAVEEFLAAAAAAPEARDAVLTWHEAVASHDARLYLRADRLLALLGSSAGPRVAEQAAKLRAQIAPLLKAEPSAANVDWYVGRARTLYGSDHPKLARLFAEEALSVAKRRPDCHACTEAEQLLSGPPRAEATAP